MLNRLIVFRGPFGLDPRVGLLPEQRFLPAEAIEVARPGEGLLASATLLLLRLSHPPGPDARGAVFLGLGKQIPDRAATRFHR